MMRRHSILDEIRSLDPVKDHQRIVHLSTCYEFPFDTTRSLEFALFRTYAVPSIGALLDQTGEFAQRPQKRYDDTDLIVSELMEWGYDSERGAKALRRMNQIHGRFEIANEDYQYVLSTFIFEPIRWNARFGWRVMCEQEKLGMFHFWSEVGRRMNITDIPASYEAFDRFNRAFEQAHFRYSEASHRVGQATYNLFAGWFPRIVQPLVRRAIHAMLDEPLRKAFGFPRPSRLLGWLLPRVLRLRARFLRLLPPRRRPRLRTEMAHPTYPHGYGIESLGPPLEPDASWRTR
jgi:ER-bound oxygenase mpaB/B'/Rubber oxygenase, catalytic domain